MSARGKPFGKGRGGDPAGRKRGLLHRAASALERVLDDRAEAIVRKAAELAEAGDATALRLRLDRLVPPRRDRAVAFAPPEIAAPADLPGDTSPPSTTSLAEALGPNPRYAGWPAWLDSADPRTRDRAGAP